MSDLTYNIFIPIHDDMEFDLAHVLIASFRLSYKDEVHITVLTDLAFTSKYIDSIKPSHYDPKGIFYLFSPYGVILNKGGDVFTHDPTVGNLYPSLTHHLDVVRYNTNSTEVYLGKNTRVNFTLPTRPYDFGIVRHYRNEISGYVHLNLRDFKPWDCPRNSKYTLIFPWELYYPCVALSEASSEFKAVIKHNALRYKHMFLYLPYLT